MGGATGAALYNLISLALVESYSECLACDFITLPSSKVSDNML